VKPALRRILVFAWLAAGSATAWAQPMGADAARHLLNRTGFEAHAAQIAEYAKYSRTEAVDRLIAGAVPVARTPAPAWTADFISPRRFRELGDEEKKQFQREQLERAIELKNWWVTEMLTTPSPLSERMTLFWHNHFTSGLQKVKSGTLMYRQNVLLRKHALGNFGEMLHAVGKDPAMLVYLDSASNRRGQPNENFAREAMELFTLGEGNYSEQDIREAARAFTGWSINPDTGDFLWRAFAHDAGTKTVLGRSGYFNGDDVLDVLLAHPKMGEFMVAKLWREFVSPDPEAREVARIAKVFRESRFEIRPVLRALLVSDAFYAPHNRGVLVKSPVDLVIGTMRQFDIAYSDPLPLTFMLRTLGQDLFSPPNVKGWPGGETWINSTTLLVRRQFLERLFRVDESRMQANREALQADMRAKGVAKLPDGRERFLRAALDMRFSGGDWLRQFGEGDARPALQRVLLALPPASGEAVAAQGVELIRRITADPAYQLK
jgi:uncharacterized protein (DUF1800 family)